MADLPAHVRQHDPMILDLNRSCDSNRRAMDGPA
jgi:hypothetical protein